MVGLGTIINVSAIVVGALIGVGLGHRLPERTRAVVTDSLGMLVLVIAALNIVALRNQDWVDEVIRIMKLDSYAFVLSETLSNQHLNFYQIFYY